MLAKKLWAFALTAALLSIPVLAASSGEKVKAVDGKYVCFMMGKRFAKPQQAVVVDGKKYYGCCEHCRAQLREDPATRFAIDPVNGKQVDKADAVIGVDKAGNVYFFESTANLKKFRVPTSAPAAVTTGECAPRCCEKCGL